MLLRTIRRTDWLQLLFVRFRWLAAFSALALCLLIGLVGGWLVVTAGPFITAGLVVGVAGGFWMLRDIEVGYWALAAVICLLPFGKLPFDIGFKPSFLDLVIGTLFLVWLVDLMLGSSRDGLGNVEPSPSGEGQTYGTFRAPQFVGTQLGLPILVFMLLAIAAFVAGLAHAPLSSLVARRFAEVILSIFLFYIVVNTVRRPNQLARLARVIILAGFVTAMVGITLYFLPDSLSIDLLSALGRFDYPVGPGILRYIRDDPSLPQRATATSV
ncbi:MAG: hypothetical protein JSV36_07420, partial [Anaerolineae bacterium]